MTPRGIERAARIADGLNPIAISRDQLEALVTAYRGAAQAAGRDLASLIIAVRANTTLSPEPLPEAGRPFLGGSAEQIARDLDSPPALQVDQVFIGSGYAPQWMTRSACWSNSCRPQRLLRAGTCRVLQQQVLGAGSAGAASARRSLDQ